MDFLDVNDNDSNNYPENKPTIPSIIYAMVKAKQALSYIHDSEQDIVYRDIYERIQKYIDESCPHSKVYDTIDIHPEKSETICYCVYCETTFTK